MEHCLSYIPDTFVQDLLSQEVTRNPDSGGAVERIVVEFKSLPSAPHMGKYTLYLIKRRSFSIVVTNNKILVKVCTNLENII